MAKTEPAMEQPRPKVDDDIVYGLRMDLRSDPSMADTIFRLIANDQPTYTRQGMYMAQERSHGDPVRQEGWLEGYVVGAEAHRRQDTRLAIQQRSNEISEPVDWDNVTPIERVRKRRFKPIRLWLGGVAAAQLINKNKPKSKPLEEI